MIEIRFNGAGVVARLAAVEARLADPTPMYKDIGEYMIDATRERFRIGTAPDGTKWLPKRASTLARYLADGDGERPDPLIGASRRLSREIQKFASRDGVEIGSALEYSGAMQFGAAKGAFGTYEHGGRNHSIPWGRIPARVWLGVATADEVVIGEIADAYLAEPLDRA